MKKKSLIMIVTIALAFVMLMTLGGCNALKLNKDYNLYTFEAEKGDFVKNISKITFAKKDYGIYDNTGKLADEGEYTLDNSAITFIPDKVGDATDRMAAASIKYSYKDYIVDGAIANFYAERWTHTTFEDKKGLEGIYTIAGTGFVLLSKGGLFVSYDGGNTMDSFTDKVGEYKLNKNKDFVEIEIYDNEKLCLLHFTYQNQYDQTVSALVDMFYSVKAPKITQVQDTRVELYSQVFVSTSIGGDMADYSLSLITFPSKDIITSNVTFEVDDPNATISGNKLTYQGGAGTVDVKFKYKNYSGEATVSIVKFAIKNELSESDRTFSEGDELSFNDIFALFVDFDTAGDRVDLSVKFKDTNLVSVESDSMVSGGLVSFDKQGEVTAILTARYVTHLFTNNAPNVVTVSKEIKLIIVE